MTRERITRRALLNSAGAFAPALAGVTATTTAQAVPDTTVPASTLAYLGHIELETLPVAAPGDEALAVRGGAFSGRRLAGAVQSGRVQCTRDARGRLQQLQVQLVVRTADGSLVELRDRVQGPGSSDASLGSQPQLAGAPLADGPRPSLLVGRIDASRIAAGSLRLLGFEVG